ncbi:unnamed protein product, partial [Didymodactylos carnosus]
FHLSHRLTEKFPESCLLIVLGLIVGALLYVTHLAEQKAYVLNSDTFFLFLLPPIILEAGYFMPNRPFFDNLGTILLLAIVNTLFNTICIGLTLWGLSFTPLFGGTKFGMLPCLVFASLISAVDPVAVLATFTEIHVNDMLYIVVFGESLLNDAVSVVLYRMFDAFARIGQENLIPLDIVLGCLSFFVVALGGVLIGIIFGVIACFTTKFTEHTPVLEPLIILVYAYLSYLTSEMVSVSGILAYDYLLWHGITIFANIANTWRLLELTRIDMLIMSYGGLRGAIAFALALILDENTIPQKKEFVTATIAVVFFTVFIQGITIGPLVKLLNVRRKQTEEPTMSAKLTNRMMDHVMTCLEEISGSSGSNSLRDKCRNLDRNYFKRWLLRETPQERMDIKLLQTFKKISTQSAMKVHDLSKGLVPAMHASQSAPALKPENAYTNMAHLLAANLQHEQTVPDLMFFDAQQSEQKLDDAKLHHFLDNNMFIARPRAPIHLRNQDETHNISTITNSDRFDHQLHHRSNFYMPPKVETTKESKRNKTDKSGKIITHQSVNNNDNQKRSSITPSPTSSPATSHHQRSNASSQDKPYPTQTRSLSSSPQLSVPHKQKQQQSVQNNRTKKMTPSSVQEETGSTAAESTFPWRNSMDASGVPVRLTEQPLTVSAFGSYTTNDHFSYATTTRPEDNTYKANVKNLFGVNEQQESALSDDGEGSHRSTDVEIRTSFPSANSDTSEQTTTRL